MKVYPASYRGRSDRGFQNGPAGRNPATPFNANKFPRGPYGVPKPANDNFPQRKVLPFKPLKPSAFRAIPWYTIYDLANQAETAYWQAHSPHMQTFMEGYTSNCGPCGTPTHITVTSFNCGTQLCQLRPGPHPSEQQTSLPNRPSSVSTYAFHDRLSPIWRYRAVQNWTRVEGTVNTKPFPKIAPYFWPNIPRNPWEVLPNPALNPYAPPGQQGRPPEPVPYRAIPHKNKGWPLSQAPSAGNFPPASSTPGPAQEGPKSPQQPKPEPWEQPLPGVVPGGLPRRPEQGVTEKKTKVQMAYRVAARLINAATESLDVLDVVWKALDRDVRRRAFIENGYRPLNYNQRARLIAKHLKSVSGSAVVKGLITNQIEDYLLGKLSNKAARNLEAMIRSQFGGTRLGGLGVGND